jgi:hypothetical protein
MLHNGKADIGDMNKDMATEICEAYSVKDFSLSSELHNEELEQYGNVVSVSCRETVCVTFDVVWKKNKSIIIKYCDDELFLERVSLDGVAEVDLLAVNDRFQAMISAGTPYVKEHRILEELRSRCSTLSNESKF